MFFGDVLTIVGLFFTLFCIPFIFAFAYSINWKSSDVSDDSPVIQGQITDVVATGTSINEQTVYEYHYQFKLDGSPTYTGVSYMQGASEQLGDSVLIQYSPENPADSRIQGMRNGEIGFWIFLFIIPFLAVGIALLTLGTRKMMRNLHLLKIGKVAYGTFMTKEPTNTKINKQTVYKFTFGFTTDDGTTHFAEGKTHQTWRLEDEATERLVYDPANPNSAVMIDSLPRVVKNYFDKLENN